MTNQYPDKIEAIPRTPYEDAVHRLAQPVAYGYKGCPKIFGPWPIPDNSGTIQAWERTLYAHQVTAGHKRRRLKEVRNEPISR